ncbi:MAG: tRNA lysidine(34) synthetase TilS [Propionibacteriales bacterium]|nr:tRNA lysidine(34) synthetase TilS [Propionibacteriales bacterium]
MARKALGSATKQLVDAIVATAGPLEPWVVGCSGGPDSLALALAARPAAEILNAGVTTIVVDHGLQSDSADVAAGVLAQLERHGVSAKVVTVTPYGPGGPEAAARRARLDALIGEAEAHDGQVLLGHTMDDQAEQVLLGLARGSGTRSLSGMAPDTGVLTRPFLGLRRTVIDQACEELGLEPWTDPHNSDESFARVRARRNVLPTLERELGPGITEALARSADLLRDDADALDGYARGLVDSSSPRLEVGSLRPHPPAIRRRALRDWLKAHGARDLNASHLRAVDGLITQGRGDGTIQMPGLEVHRVRQQLLAR